MAIKTLDITALVSILSKRSRQISSRMKTELDDKLAYFEGFEPELEDPRFQEEQSRISIEFERKPEPTELAIEEMFEDEVYYRDSSVEL